MGGGVTRAQKGIPTEGKEGGWMEGDWVTLPPSASSSPAFQRRPLRQDRWLVAALLLLTSALSLSPLFPFLYLLPALFSPHRPHAAQLAGVAVRSQSQPSTPSLLRPILLPHPYYLI